MYGHEHCVLRGVERSVHLAAQILPVILLKRSYSTGLWQNTYGDGARIPVHSLQL